MNAAHPTKPADLASKIAAVPTDDHGISRHLAAAIHQTLTEQLPELQQRQLWRERNRTWWYTLGVLTRWAAVTGTAHVPANSSVGRLDGVNLGAWLANQRQRHHKTPLEPTRLALLSALPGFSLDPHADRWEASYAALVDWTQTSGHARPTDGDTHRGINLANWVRTQRSRQHHNTLPVEQARRLAELPGWTFDPHRELFEASVHALRVYARRTGSRRGQFLVIGRGTVVNGINLFHFANNIRSRAARGEISQADLDLLATVDGWALDRHDAQWRDMHFLVEEYAHQHGHTHIPVSYVVEGLKLGYWAAHQRDEHSHGRLRQDRAVALERIRGWNWSNKDAAWHYRLTLATQHLKRTGRTRMPRDLEIDGIKVGRWFHEQRRHALRGALPPHRAAALHQLPGWSQWLLASTASAHRAA